MMYPMCVLIFLALVFSTTETRDINIVNNCPMAVWPVIQGPGNPEDGGFFLPKYASKVIYVEDEWSGKIWARTQCDSEMNCKTGSCGKKEKCHGADGEAPFTVAEFTLRGAGGKDSYSVSLVDGFNLPIYIEPTGEFEGSCKKAGGCDKDVNLLCSRSHVSALVGDRPVGCKSECLKFNTDEKCCRGNFGSEGSCRQTINSKMFKKSCYNNRIFEYESKDKFQCSEANYLVQIC